MSIPLALWALLALCDRGRASAARSLAERLGKPQLTPELEDDHVKGCEIYFVLVDDQAATDLMTGKPEFVKLWIQMYLAFGESGLDITEISKVASGYDKVKYKVTVQQICDTPLSSLVGQHWWSGLDHCSYADDGYIPQGMLDLSHTVTLVATSCEDLPLSDFNPDQITVFYLYDDNGFLLRESTMKAVLKKIFGTTAEHALIYNAEVPPGKYHKKYVVTWKPTPHQSKIELRQILKETKNYRTLQKWNEYVNDVLQSSSTTILDVTLEA